jgi:tripartite-type tricarboxylate transporter receptor subunit TctC
LALLVGVGAAVQVRPAHASDYPSKPIRLVVPFPAGGPTDVTARVVAQALSKGIGQQIVVDNRAGAGGNVGAEIAANAPADGYTVFFATGGTHGINPSLYKRVPYDPVKSFDPVILVSTSPNVFVAHPRFPANTMAELIAYAKANPGKVNYATAGAGTTTHMSAELLRSLTGIDITHVPYRGSAPAMNDLLAGQVELMVDGLPSAMPHIRAGSIKALGLTTAKRIESAPDIPAIAETVPGYEAVAWFAFLVPAGTPKDVIAKLNEEANRALASDEVKRRYAELGSDPAGGPPEKLQALIGAELAKWAGVVRATGAQVE